MGDYDIGNELNGVRKFLDLSLGLFSSPVIVIEWVSELLRLCEGAGARVLAAMLTNIAMLT